MFSAKFPSLIGTSCIRQNFCNNFNTHRQLWMYHQRNLRRKYVKFKYSVIFVYFVYDRYRTNILLKYHSFPSLLYGNWNVIFVALAFRLISFYCHKQIMKPIEGFFLLFIKFSISIICLLWVVLRIQLTLSHRFYYLKINIQQPAGT